MNMVGYDKTLGERLAVLRFALLVAALLVPRWSSAAPGADSPAPDPSAAPAASASAGEPAPGGEQAEPSPWQKGPTHLELGHDVTIDLPADYGFLPKEPAAKVLEANGGFYNGQPARHHRRHRRARGRSTTTRVCSGVAVSSPSTW
jgi:hypothetical protein